MPPPDLRNSAKGAVVVAAFGNFQVGVMGGCAEHPFGELLRMQLCLQVVEYLLQGVYPEPGIHFGHLLFQFFPVALC